MKKLFFALIASFLFVATSWGQCTKDLVSSVTISAYSEQSYTIEEDGYTKVSFYISKNMSTAVGGVIVTIYDKDGEVISGGRTIGAGDIEGKNKPNYFEVSSADGKTYIKSIKFDFSNGVCSFKRTITNVVVEKSYFLSISPIYINFGNQELNSINENTLEIGYSALIYELEEDLTVNLAQQDNVFSTSLTGTSTNKKTVAEANCSTGNKTITTTFKPTEYGVYTNQLEFSNGTKVFLRGECSKCVQTTLAVDNNKVSYTSVGLTWNKVEDKDLSGYTIINQTTGAIYTATKEQTSLNATGLEIGKTYSFIIFPMLNGAKSLCGSNVVTATTKYTDKIKDCLIYSSPKDEAQNLIASDAINNSIYYNLKENNSASLKYTKRVTFEAKWGNWALIEPSMGGRGDLCLYAKVKDNNGNVSETKCWSAANVGLTKEYQTFSATIPHNTTEIEFRTGLGNGAAYRYVRNLNVYKDYILESNTQHIDFGVLDANVPVTKEFDITKYAHGIALAEITLNNLSKTVVNDNNGFYKVEYTSLDECAEDNGENSIKVKVTLTPTCCADNYDATLSLLNGANLYVTLTGTLKRNPGTVNKITWTGAEDTNWDNRDNWTKENGSVLSAADVLSEDLLVVIPAEKERYPVIPDVHDDTHFKTNRDKACDCAQVNAGDNASATTTMIAHKIVLEQGASIVGVETLYNPSTGVRRYHEVENQFDARRQDWLLVGTVVKPWDESGNGEVRNILSEDYFLGHFPQVYMHEAVIDQENHVTWQQSFTDLNKEVPKNKAFAIYVANEYGAYYFPAETFDYYNGTSYAATLAHPHRYTFTGHFYNESSVITYDNLTPNQPVLLCNTYPAAIDAYALNNAVNGTIEYYDYTTSKSFVTAKEGAVILPQNGFVFTPGDDVTSLTIGAEYMITGGTASRSTIATPTSCRIKANNAAQAVSSEISIQYDQEKEDVADFSIDAPKLFAKETYGLPDVYVIRHNANWADITIPNMTEPIPLGVTINGSNQTFTLEMIQNNMPYTFVLEDRTTSTMYNLSNGEVCTVSGLKKGDYKGRFYLHATPIQEEDDNQLTNIDEELAQNNNIDIFVQEGTVIVSATQEAQLQSIVVSDMVGRSTTYTVNDQYAEISLPKSKGIYIINVVGEAGIATKKVRL